MAAPRRSPLDARVPLLALLLALTGCAVEPGSVRGPGFDDDPSGDPGPGDDVTDTGDDVLDTGADTGEDPGEDPPSEDCPAGLVCVDTFPFSQAGDTRTGADDFDAYACSPGTDESGPEIRYRVDLPARGFLAVQVDGMPSGVDIDVHLLSALDPDRCIDRGHFSAGALLDAGSWYVVADSWVDDTGTARAGEYTLTLGFTPADAFTLQGLREPVLDKALYAFETGWLTGETDRFEYTVIDFELPSTDRRLWTMDLATGSLLFRELVTHGEGSGDPSDPRLATTFSNVDGSHQSSLGLARTAEVYSGSHGRSLRYDGLEPDFNDAVRSRAIVLHRADYATQDFVDQHGYLGRSWGCTVVDPDVADDLIDTIEGGSLVFSYYPDADWLDFSAFLAGYP